MARGRPIGTIFVDLDLSTEEYTKKQKQIIRESQSTALSVEKNWRIIGSQSDKMYDAMRQRINNAYEAIKHKATSTADEIVRAEKAAKEQMRRIDEQQFGRQTSLISKVKDHWMGLTAAFYAGYRVFRRVWDLIINKYGEFEVALSRLGNVSERSMGSLKDSILNVDPALGKITELTKGYYQVLSAGVTGQKESIDLLVVSSKMAKESAIEQGEAVKGLASVMSAYSTELKGATNAADLLYYIEKQGITTVGELMPLIGNLANLSRATGLSANEMAAALAQITTTGAGTNESVTQLQSLLTNLSKHFKDLPKEIREYGSATEAIKELGFENVMKKIWDSTDGNSTALIKMLGRQEAYLALLQLSKNDFGEYSDKLTEMGDKGGAFNDAWERYSQTLKASIEDLSNTVERILLPNLESWAGWLKNIAIYYGNIFEVNKSMDKLVLENLTKQLEDLETKRKNVLKASGGLQGIIMNEEWLDYYNNLNAQIKTTKGSIATLNDELDKTKNKSKEAADNMAKGAEDATKKYQTLEEFIESDIGKALEKEFKNREAWYDKRLRLFKEHTLETERIQIEAIDDQFKKLEAQKDLEIKIYQQSDEAKVVSAKDREERIAAIEAKYLTDRAELEEKAKDKAIKAAEIAQKKIESDQKHMLKRMHDTTADFIYDLMDGQIKSWRDMFDRVLDWFKKLLSDMIAQAILNSSSIRNALAGVFSLPSGIGGMEGTGTTGIAATLGLTDILTGAGYGLGGSALANLLGGGKGSQFGAGLGAFLGGTGISLDFASLGVALWGPIGAAIGAALGFIIGGLFDKSPNTFTITEIIKDNMKWDPNLGLNVEDLFGPSPHDSSHWVQPIHDAVIQGATELITDFNDRIFEILETVPPEMADSIRTRLATYNFDFSDLFEGRWDVTDAESVVKGIIEQITLRLTNVLNDLVNTGGLDYLQGIITGSDFFGALSTGAQESILARFNAADTVEDILDLITAFDQGAAVFEEISWQAGMMAGIYSDLEMQQYNINKKFDEWILILRALGVAEEEITKIEEYRTQALNNAAISLLKYESIGLIDPSKAFPLTNMGNWLDIQHQVLSFMGELTPLEEELYRINKMFDAWIEQLKALYATETMILWVEDKRTEALENAANGIEDITNALTINIDRIRAQYLELLTGPSNPIDILDRLKIMEGQLAPIGAALTEADLARYLEYLKLAQEAYQRPSPEYQAIYDLVLSAYEAVLQTHDPGFVGRGGDSYEQTFNFTVEIKVDGSKSPEDTGQAVKYELTKFMQGSGRRMVQDAFDYRGRGWQ